MRSGPERRDGPGGEVRRARAARRPSSTGQSQWNWPSTGPLPLRLGPNWLDVQASVSSRYASGETSTTWLKPGVRHGAVVALEVVLDRDLPVAGELELARRRKRARRARSRPPAKQLGQRAERLGERRRVGIGVDEHQRAPGRRPPARAGRCRRARARPARCGAQPAVELVRPRVVRALQRLAVAAALERRASRGGGRRSGTRAARRRGRGDDDRHVADAAREVSRRAPPRARPGRRTASRGERSAPAPAAAAPGRSTSSTEACPAQSRRPNRPRLYSRPDGLRAHAPSSARSRRWRASSRRRRSSRTPPTWDREHGFPRELFGEARPSSA